MSEPLEIPAANQVNIAIFSREPGQDVISEIRTHVRATSKPHTWRGHSHTRPPNGAFVVYIEEFDVPAPDSVERVAPCPCCNPFHPQYKNKGKIAWFPDEEVIRLIGPQCYAKINNTGEGGHADALVALRKRQKRQREIDTIRFHETGLASMIETLEEMIDVAEDLDAFKTDLGSAFDTCQIGLWREVKDGVLSISETRKVSFVKRDGEMGERTEVTKIPFARLEGAAMIERSGRLQADRLCNYLATLTPINERLQKVGSPDLLDDRDRERFADILPRARTEISDSLKILSDRQRFLIGDAIEVLHNWGQHDRAPFRFTIKRTRFSVAITAKPRGWFGDRSVDVPIGHMSEKSVGSLLGIV